MVATPTLRDTARRALVPLASAVGFTALSLPLALIVAILAIAAGMWLGTPTDVLQAEIAKLGTGAPVDATELLGPTAWGWASIAMFGGLAALALLLSRLFDDGWAFLRVEGTRPELLRGGLYAVGIGALLGYLPTHVVHSVFGWSGEGSVPLDPADPDLVLITAAVLVGPICEELFFRGFLWRAWAPMGRLWAPLGIAAPLAVTTLLFGAAHVALPHVLAAIWMGLFFAGLRVATGSFWFGAIAHVTNNALATLGALYGGAELSVSLAVITGVLATGSLVVLLSRQIDEAPGRLVPVT